MKKELILVGGGGHCKACIDVIEAQGEYSIAGIVDLKGKIGELALNYKIIACDEDLPKLAKEYKYFLISIGQIKALQKRAEKFKILKGYGVEFPVIISPLSYVSKHASIDEGTIVMHRVAVNAAAKVGKNCILNTGAVIEHDVVIKDNCHIATCAVVNGGTVVGENCFIGSNSAVREGIQVGSGSVIGAGVTILSSLPEKSFVKNDSD